MHDFNFRTVTTEFSRLAYRLVFTLPSEIRDIGSRRVLINTRSTLVLRGQNTQHGLILQNMFSSGDRKNALMLWHAEINYAQPRFREVDVSPVVCVCVAYKGTSSLPADTPSGCLSGLRLLSGPSLLRFGPLSYSDSHLNPYPKL
eukprot:2657868-Rhodomonas_salina.4